MATPVSAFTRLDSVERSSVMSCETFTTETCGSPDSAGVESVGLDRTGRLQPGAGPTGEGSAAHQTSPRFMANGPCLCGGKGRIQGLLRCVMNGVQLFSHLGVLAPSQVFLDSLRIKLSARHAKPLREVFCGGEDSVRQ